MKKFLLLLSAALIVMGAIGCSKAEETPQGSTATTGSTTNTDEQKPVDATDK